MTSPPRPAPRSDSRASRPFRAAAVRLLGAALALSFASAAPAQDLVGWVNGGWALPADPPEFRQLWSGAVSYGGGLGVRVAPEWEVGVAFHVQRFGADERAQADEFLLTGFGVEVPIARIEGHEVTAVSLTGETRFQLRADGVRSSPFLAFGWGYFRLDEADAVVTPTLPGYSPAIVLGRVDHAFVSTIGVGMRWSLTSRYSILLDSIYTIGFTEPTSTQYLPLRVGIGIH